jgi:antitoxin VapB
MITMALNIRSEETEELAQRLRRARARRRLADELDEIALHCSALPVRDTRTADEIMGYDENGLPR